jgi:hypothetical protein
MRRFILLEHDYPTTHWDLMLEIGSVLRTWRLASPPRPGDTIEATAISDHRLMYLDYEGPISGNRGRVVRWDRGTFTTQEWREERIVVALEGERLYGTLTLEHGEDAGWRTSFQATEPPLS